MKTFAAFTLTLLLAACASGGIQRVTDPDLPHALPGSGPVAVSWTDPAQFSELRMSNNRYEAERGDWVRQLAAYLQESAARMLPAGEHLELVITDIRRAGNYPPWGGSQLQDVRLMRDIDWPRMTVEFIRRDAAGNVIAQGEGKASDPGYLGRAGGAGSNDPLRYEKRMIDDWVRAEFGAHRR